MGLVTDDKHAHLRMTMSMRYLEAQLVSLEPYGFSRQDALAALELSEADFLDPKGRTDVARVERMYLTAAKVLSEPRIGMQIGYQFRVHDYGRTGSIYTYCHNMAEVIEMNQRYQRIAVDIALPEYREEEGRHYFIFHPYPEVQSMHQVMGVVLGSYATSFRWLSWSAGHELQEVMLMPSAPVDTTMYEEAMKCPIIFGGPRNHAEFHRDVVEKPLITADPEKLAQAVIILDKILKSGDAAENFKASIGVSIRSAMMRGAVSLAVVASRMKMSERMLRYRLNQLGLNFRDMLDVERKKRFHELHADNESFATISQALAYNDQAAFNRAFKRWYGMTPGAYKKLNEG